MSEENTKEKENSEGLESGYSHKDLENMATDKENGFYGIIKFIINPLTEKQIKFFKDNLELLIKYFPEEFKNPYTGEIVTADFLTFNANQSEGHIGFKMSEKVIENNALKDLEERPFFALKLKDKKSYRVDARRNKGTMFILSVLSILKTIDPEIVYCNEQLNGDIESIPSLVLDSCLRHKEEVE